MIPSRGSDAVSEPPNPPAATILFVEDEPLVRMEMAEFLRECGYRVHEASTSKEAIDVLEAKFVVDLVFTDITMPGLLDGADLARVVMSEYPATKVVMTTGVASNAADLATLPLLHKPYSFDDLRRLVERLIGKPDAL